MIMVSIITPCYNAASTIRATIESVLAQNYTDWEMLIVDDCSTDSSAEIIKFYSQKDNRIVFFKTDYPSGSPAHPRNIGIENAKGDYIAFLDADDIWLPQKLDQQMRLVSEKNYEFIYSDYEKINAAGIRSNRTIKMPSYATYKDVIKTCVIPCLTVVISKNAIGSTRFKSIPKEDLVFWLEILKKGITAYNSNDVLALYREQRKSRSSDKLKMIRGQWNILRNIEGIKPIKASLYIIIYIVKGFFKFIK
ncbi:MAG: glycosyltransferase family 2 protein [Bacteroides sp.]|nr:glycosyltransferase family 2 protein [Bacteroides sp.]